MEINATDSLVECKIYLDDIDGTDGVITTAPEPHDYGSGFSLYPEETFAGIFHTPILQLASDSTKFRWRMEISTRAVGSTAPIIKFGLPIVRPVAAFDLPTPTS